MKLRALPVLLAALVLASIPSARGLAETAAASGPAVAEEAGSDASAPSEPRLLRHGYTSVDGKPRDAFLYLPIGYDDDPDRRWPLILFLHGNGERGNGREDLDWVLSHGPLYEAWIQKRDLPFLILAPQLPLFGFDEIVDYIRDRDPADMARRLDEGVPPRPAPFATPRPMTGAVAAESLPLGATGAPMGWPEREKDLLLILDQVGASYRVDPSRVYLTGLSYGGFGSWYLASEHPQRFAAVAPVVGWGHPDLMAPLAERQMPIWVFAGGRDLAVQPRHFYPGLQKLEALGHRDVRFTIHADTGHDAWVRVYRGQDLYDWFLSNRLDSLAGDAAKK